MNKFKVGDTVCKKPLVRYEVFTNFTNDDLFIVPFKIVSLTVEDDDIYSYRCESLVSHSGMLDVRHTSTFQEYEIVPWSARKEEVIQSFERYLDKLRNV